MSKRKTAVKKKASAKKAAPLHTIDIIASAMWLRALPRAKAIAKRAALAALEHGAPKRRQTFEVSLVLTSDAQVRRLNRDYRHQDKPTNVLSFPAGEEAFPLLGDVVIAYGVTRREAISENKALAAHLTHLVIHGVLHLLGYDHIHDTDAVVMERRESAIMARMGLNDPYAAPLAAKAPVKKRR